VASAPPAPRAIRKPRVSGASEDFVPPAAQRRLVSRIDRRAAQDHFKRQTLKLSRSHFTVFAVKWSACGTSDSTFIGASPRAAY